jgi:imidazolonepropionase
MKCDRVWFNARLATMREAAPASIDAGVVAATDGRIAYAGAAGDAPAIEASESIDCGGRLVTPGLIDCHTHLAYAGDRAAEFEHRIAGASYEEIARAGGGILSTVAQTRAASEAQLVAESVPRLDALIAEGVTTIEVKSGYGLSLEHELKILRAIRRLGELRDVRLRATLLGAHALPPEAGGDKDAYIRLVSEEMIPPVAREGLAVSVDGFCEGIAFSPAQLSRVFDAAKAHGLSVKLHAEQLSNLHGAALAARFGALSADHLEHVDGEGIAAMANAGTVAVLLPGAYYFTRETNPPPVAQMRAAGLRMAIATDCNPGTSPLTSILLAMNMAATLFRLTVAECLAGVTREAAFALGLQDEIGTLEAGKACDLAIWNAADPAELVYRMGFNPLHTRVRNGR